MLYYILLYIYIYIIFRMYQSYQSTSMEIQRDHPTGEGGGPIFGGSGGRSPVVMGCFNTKMVQCG